MKKVIIYPLIEIFVITILLSYSFPARNDIYASTELINNEAIELKNNLQIHKLKDSNVKIINEDFDFYSINVIANNISNFEVNGKVMLMYSKLSTIDYNDLMININGEDFELSKLYSNSNKDYDVFIIDESIFSPYQNKEYMVNYKVKENVTYDKILGKYFDSNIEIIEK